MTDKTIRVAVISSGGVGSIAIRAVTRRANADTA
jgi:tRNA A37 threonylcarbamoyladenosine dehydratase